MVDRGFQVQRDERLVAVVVDSIMRMSGTINSRFGIPIDVWMLEEGSCVMSGRGMRVGSDFGGILVGILILGGFWLGLIFDD